MTHAAKSLFVFGVYLAVGGLMLVIAPALACQIAGLRPPGESIWVRVAGMFFLYSAFYCFCAAKSGRTEFIKWSVFTRPCTLLLLAPLAATRIENPTIIIFGLIDVAAAIWTAVALRADMRNGWRVASGVRQARV